MKTRTGNISAEGVTIGSDGIRVDGGFYIAKTRQPKRYSWNPQEDITTYELALCLPVLLISIRGLPFQSEIDQLPENCKRHFTEE